MRREVALPSLEHARPHALERSEGPLPSLEVDSTHGCSLEWRSRVVPGCSDLNRARLHLTSSEGRGGSKEVTATSALIGGQLNAYMCVRVEIHCEQRCALLAASEASGEKCARSRGTKMS